MTRGATFFQKYLHKELFYPQKIANSYNCQVDTKRQGRTGFPHKK